MAFGLELRAAGYLARPEDCSLSTGQRSFKVGKKKMLKEKGNSVICSPEDTGPLAARGEIQGAAATYSRHPAGTLKKQGHF